MAKAISKKTVTREAYETALKSFVQNNNKYEKLAAARDAKVAKIDAEYGDQFSNMKNEMEDDFLTVQRYCEDNRTELFVGAKSLDAFGAHVGFREGKEKVSFMDGWNEKKVLEKMQKSEHWLVYVRLKPSIDKAALLKEQPKGMEKCGIVIEQEESFFLEPETTEVEA
jgi:phage host-nuclease inhibitor protein Gam